MRKPSRYLPPAPTRPLSAGAWVLLIVTLGTLLAGLLQLVLQAPWVVLAMLLLLVPGVHGETRRTRRHLATLAASRPGQSICQFARDFERRRVDSWIIRATYEQLQQQMACPGFPLRAADRLREDLLLDDDDIDLDLAPDIAARCGRTLDGAERNPYSGRLHTVGDLVLFFNAQPAGAGPAPA